MPENNTRVWEISLTKGMVELFPSTASSLSLDSITRKLQQGLYSTFRTFDGGKRVLGLRAHLKRLYQPAVTQPTKPAVPVEFLRLCLAELLKEYPDEARVRVIMTRDGQVYVVIEALKLISTIQPPADNVVLMTDGLPTIGLGPSLFGKVSARRRLNLFKDAVQLIPKELPINVILYQIEGDPEAAAAFWGLARASSGSFFCPSRDWP